MTYGAMAYIVMAYGVMAYIVMVHVVMAFVPSAEDILFEQAPY